MATVIAVIGRSMLKRRLFSASRSTDHRPPPLNKKLTADPSTGGKKKHKMEKVTLIRDGETCCLMAEIGVNALVHNALGRVATDNVWRRHLRHAARRLAAAFAACRPAQVQEPV
ncbi:hypothetical protein ACYG9R_03565 [Mesorhizobium sp. RSR565B]|uniref:hypothetical protein n=1 Tax=unclassified Mesorhizobium TaxID=325217 RepID=UPI001FDAB651|nr:hypothetical protein [Mesorhizobium sp. L103C565B0]